MAARIAVISDTHLHAPTPWFERVFETHLRGADILVHCGDVNGHAMLEYLQLSHPRFVCALGNMDDQRIAGELSAQVRFEAEGFRLGAAHGYGPRSQVYRAVLESFGPGFDVLCFGHTHAFFWQRVDQTWMLNPGSLQEHDRGGFAWLELDSGEEPRVTRVERV